MVQPEVIDLTSDIDDVQLVKKRKDISQKDSSKPRKKSKSKSPKPENLFFVDVEIQPDSRPSPLKPEFNDSTGKLLLPAHVSVLGSVPVEIIAPASEDQDYVEYLDYGGPDELGITRYFQVQTDKAKTHSVIVCKRCGAKGQHRTTACPVIICLTCGVRNEHSTNSCPISKVCFSCGMKGHLNASCPNRGKLANTYDDCDRCGSTVHATNACADSLFKTLQSNVKPPQECPTHWRIYTHTTAEDRTQIMEVRKSKQAYPLGQGGEGYIAEDCWCYNCGDSGHWGDDCDAIPHIHDIPADDSAFGNNNLLTGPFSEIESGKTERPPREWELDDSSQWNDWGGRVPINVGKQARKKEMARMRANQVEEDDEDDRFTFLAKPMRDSSRKNSGNGNGQKPPSQPKKMRFELNVKGAAKLEVGNSGRLQKDDIRRRKEPGGRERDNSYRDRDRNSYREKERDRGRDKRRREDEQGPRYKGGYGHPNR